LANKYYQILLAYTLVIPWLSLDRFPQQENGRCSVPQGQWPFTHCADVPSRMYSLTHSLTQPCSLIATILTITL